MCVCVGGRVRLQLGAGAWNRRLKFKVKSEGWEPSSLYDIHFPVGLWFFRLPSSGGGVGRGRLGAVSSGVRRDGVVPLGGPYCWLCSPAVAPFKALMVVLVPKSLARERFTFTRSRT